jgi:nucleoside-diphosphate-sugar epimerase
VSAYVADGTSRWPAVHVLDAAVLVGLALEGAAPGTVLHAVAEEGVTGRTIAEAIGRSLDLPVTSVAPEDALEHFDWIGMLFGMDAPASSAATQAQLGWQPTHPGLVADIDAGEYSDVA